MEDVNISKYRAQVVRAGSTPASPGFVVSEGQNPVDPSGSGQNHLPVTIATAATGLSITESQVLGGAGTVGQYIRGDGSLADFPATTGGGSSVSYYLNGSVSQGTIGGVAYKELNRTPVFGTGTDISINADGYIASFITDALDPNKLLIPGGNWNFETYFSASSSGGSPSFYVELYKYDGTTFTLLATSSSSPELIAFGTNLNPYFSTLAVPETVLALTDRLAVRFYVTHSGRTITLHTEDNHLCQIITTFTTGLTALNGLTSQVQFFAVGTSGTDFAISSASDTHTFNLPTASATNRGALSSADWTTFNGKQNALTNPVTGTGASGRVAYFTGSTTISSEDALFWDSTNKRLGIGVTIPTNPLHIVSNTLSQLNIQALSGNTNAQINLEPTGTGIALIGPANAVALAFRTDATQRLAIFSNGNVTIANSPTDAGFKLDVNGTGRYNQNNTSVGNATGIRLEQAGSGDVAISYLLTGVREWLMGVDNSDSDSFKISNITGSGDFNNTGLCITTSGNVGIGTSSPGNYILALNYNASNLAVMSIQNSSSTGYSGAHILNNSGSLMGHFGYGNSSLTAPLSDLVYFGSIASKAVVFTTNDTERMRITSSGNVLIGTTTDSGGKLRVDGDVFINNSSNAQIGLNTTGALNSVGAYLYFNRSGSNKWTAGMGPYTGGNNYEIATGSVVALSLAVTTGTATFGSLGTGTVTATAGTLSTVSDFSYKIDDGYIDSAIEKVLNLKPRYFYWNEKSGLPKDIRQLGFYAQEVNQALGEEAANTPQNKNTPWGISDRSIIAMLTKAIQEQQEIINDLKQKIS